MRMHSVSLSKGRCCYFFQRDKKDFASKIFVVSFVITLFRLISDIFIFVTKKDWAQFMWE